MVLTDEQRKAIVNWLSVVQKDESKRPNIRFGSRPLPASLKPALDHLAYVFADLILTDQDCFLSEKGSEALLRLIPDTRIVETLRNDWAGESSGSAAKWQAFKAQIKTYKKDSSARAQLIAAMEDIILRYTYPRLDENVSKKRNHLLKAPFCVHPKTGRTNNRFIDKKFSESRKPRNRREQPNDKELRELGIDIDWWAELQKDNTSKNVLRDILREQRILVANGGKAPTPPTRKEHKPKKYVPRPDLCRYPLPQAKYPDLPRLAQRVHNEDKPKKTKAFFKETDDVQNLVEDWVDSFKNFPPEAQDIEYVSKFLTKAMDSKQFTDTSVERTIAVVKWWLELLRR
ncbi:REV1-C domain-containing protein [Mycena indigotica]|uniref:DNA primase n=1 Tax=Mycena indigotica TaxID=2126181 RepID=A0A8H6W0G9_9AGAR|nr:REV1-C domain-containing protein [Mycena indigotica]KAF7297078.1 REV1-C domain-containing protein [Mycena indigotica]